MKIIRISFILALVAALSVINLLYFFNTRETLIRNQTNKVEVVIDTIVSSIESDKKAEKYFNDFMADELRTAAIAIQNALPPDIEDVESDELVKLAEELELQGITLFTQQGDDIVGTKSNLPEQIGLSTKHWAKGMWYQMFHQLLTEHEVTLIPGFGEKRKNFWSGPIDTSSANPNMVSKWGYYNDGTTNYLINPFMDDESISLYKEHAGANKTIDDAETRENFVLDVSVVNSTALIEGERTTRDTGIVWLSDKLKVYGDYRYQSLDDRKYVLEALEKDDSIREIVKIKDEAILKQYHPVPFKNGDNLDDELVIIVASDYSLIQNELNEQLIQQLIASSIVFIIAFGGLYMLVRLITRRERTIFNVQEIYTEHIQSLFKTVREQRHDANHHLYTISGLMKIEAYEELTRYVETLVNLEEPTRALVDVNIPAFSGLLQSKLTESGEKGIEFEYHFEHMEHLDLKLEKITDLVRACGNVIDNAFHAVLDNPITKPKKIVIYGSYKNKELTISIQNNGAPISSDELSKIFSFGYTSRKNKGGSGIGLASSKKSLERHGGTISVNSDPEFTRFIIKMPVSNKEIVES